MATITSAVTATQLITSLEPTRSKSNILALHHALAQYQVLLAATTTISMVTWQATCFLLQNAMYISSMAALNLFLVLRHLIKTTWKRAEPIRKKIFFEFMVFILNPYAVMLFVFWPGWLIIWGLWMSSYFVS
jgi:hypothetical protein